MDKLILGLFLVFLIVLPSYALADPSTYLNIPPTNAFDKIHSDNGTISAVNFSMPLTIKGGSGITVQSSNGSHTVIISGSASPSTNKGTYNQTLSNNIPVNTNGNRLNFINGTNNPLNIVDDPTRNQVNITISSTGSGGSGVTSLNALTGALTISCVAGNTTCTTSGGNTITINTAYNIATLNLNEIFSGITTMNNLKLGGQMNINNKSFQSLGHVYTWPNNTGTVCLTNQTGTCGTMGTATYDTIQNIGSGQGSVYAGNTTKTNFTFKTLKQGSNIAITNNTNDVTIGVTGLLSTAVTSLNSDTTPSQSLQVIGSGSIADNGGGVHVITTKTYQNNTGGNLGIHGIGPFASMNAQVLQFLSLVSANSNCVFTNNSTNLILTCSTPSSITSVNSQTGPIINIVCQTGNTTCTNSTNQIQIGFGSNPIISGGSGQVINKAINFSANNKLTFLPPSSPSVAPLNIGSPTNQPSSVTAGDIWLVNGGVLRYRASGTTFQVGSPGVASTWTASQTFDGIIDLNSFFVNSVDSTKKLGLQLAGMTTGITTTIRNNATTAQGINIPATRETETFAMKPQINFTSSSNKTGTNTTPVMLGDGVTLTPQVTGRTEVIVSGYITSSVAADGGILQVRQITGSCGANGATVTGTALGSNLKITDAATTGMAAFSITVQSTGLSLGQKYCYELSQQATTGGTFTVFNVNWAAKEI